MPLKALLNDSPFLAWDLQEGHRGLDFKCPHCDDGFIVVMGKIRRKHFRHKTNRDHGTEPESENHLEMKEYFLKEAEKLGYSCELEKSFFVDDELSIADVAIYAKNHHTPLVKGIVIECQCSSISLGEMNQRTIDYLLDGLIPLWVLSGRYHERRIRGKKLTNIEKELLEKFGVLFYYGHGKIISKYFEDPRSSEVFLNDITLEILLNSALRKINSLNWMPLNAQIEIKVPFSDGIGFHQIKENQIYSLNKVRTHLSMFSDNDIFRITGQTKFYDGLELHIVLWGTEFEWKSMEWASEGHTFQEVLPSFVI